MKSKIKNIIFDWSGVIKDISESHFWVVKKMFEALGNKDITVGEIKKRYYEPYMDFWKEFFPNLSPEKEKILYREVLLSPDCPSPRAYPGIVGLIKILRSKGVRMAILSSDMPESLLPELEKFDLLNAFDQIVTSEHDKSMAIHGLIEKNKFNKKETVFIGDTNKEVEAGKAANVKTIAVTWGVVGEEKLKLTKPDYIARNIKELGEILINEK